VIGSRLGPYEVTAKLGEGGMGEVYRATDSNLRREVAIKVLPAAFTADRERLARFEREAQLLAQLNHTNIAQIYGIEASGESRALVMELVEGPTLAERLEAGALSLADSLAIALHMAQALEEAHAKGIVHRDLKPQNIKASAEGKVKVLDFGLAKAMDPAAGSASAADVARSPTIMNSPTLTAVHGTQLGVILGSAAYMAPEQARGVAVDKRADIWAFGVVLYEMLTGRRLFEGELVTDVLANVLKKEVDLAALPAEAPAAIRQLLRRCLERNPKNRLHDIADARIVLEEVLSGRGGEGEPAAPAAAVAAVPGWRRALPWIVTAAALTAAVVVVTMSGRESAPAGIVRSDLAPPNDALFFFQGDFGSPVILSPDGTTIVFGTRSRRQESLTARLWSRSLVTGEEREITGTDGAYAPFFSPDGRSIGFFANSELRTVAVTGGAAFTVAPAPSGRGGAWAADGTIVYSPNFRDVLWKVPAVGGAPAPLTKLDATKHSSHRWPVLAPAGAAVVYLAVNHSPELDHENGLRFARLDGSDDHPIVEAQANGLLAAGRLLFTRGTTLFAQPFDARAGRLEREPVAVAQEVMVDSTTWRAVAAADSRRLVHAGGASQGETRVSAYSGIDQRERQDVTAPGGYSDIAVSPDGKRLVVSRGESVGSARGDLWMIDVERGTETRFTLETEDEGTPTWSPDGRYVYYGARGFKDLKDRIFRKLSDGSGAPELVYESSADVDLIPRNLSPDGKNLMVVTGVVPFAVESDIQILPLDGSRQLKPLLDGAAADLDAFYSPDGTLVAYASLESGRGQVYVATIGPDGRAGTRWQVSVNGGRRPVWTPDGRKLLFLDERANLLAVDVDRSGPTVRFGRGSETLFSTTAVQDFNSIAVGPDGRIWMVQFGDEQSEPLRLIENWTEQLPR
jgi:Tol biopolymer transport system component